MPRPSMKKNEPGPTNLFDAHDILNNAPVGIFTSTPVGKVLSANQTIARIFGYDSSAHMIDSVTDIGRQLYADPEDRETFKALLKKNGKVDNYECRFCRVDGTEFLGAINARQIQGVGGDIGNYYGFVMDITQRKQDEEALLLTQFVMDRAPDSITWVNADGKIVYVNNVACSSMGFSREELLGMEIFDIDPDFPANGWEQHKADLKKQKRMTFETRHRTKDDRLFPVEVTTNYLEYKGRFLGIAFDRDITERREAELEKEKLQAQLLQAQKMESIGMLAGGVAHDFNNQLHAMGGNLQLLGNDKPDDHPDKKRIKTIQKSIDRAAQLVKKLLLFSRKADIQTQVLDLNREIHDASKLLKRFIPRMISIELILDENAWPIKADPIQVEQVLLNLGTNTADAMPDGGRLIIETANVTLDQTFIQTHTGAKPGKYVLMTVSDTGCGMDKETLVHIFDPFFTTKEVGRGTGLGLASVYGIVKAHDGYITCYSEPGHGTAFKIYWPVAAKEEMTSDELQIGQTVSQDGTETILAVDDNDQIRELTNEVLKDSGYQVLSAESGEQALEIFREKNRDIDLVLMDLNMPGMGGSQCTRKMITLDPSVRVLVASGYSANVHGRDILELGAKDFISKPFQMDQLLAKVRKVLDEE